MVVEEGLGSTAQTCRALGLARSSFYRQAEKTLEGRRVRKEVIDLSKEHPRYGYRRIAAVTRRAGWEVNVKRGKEYGERKA